MSGSRAKRERRLARTQRPPVLPSVAPAAPTFVGPQRYEVLHYRRDVTSSADAQPGQLLGHDEMGRPYEVLDAEFDESTGRTTVNLQYATPDNIRAAMAAAGIAS